MASRRKALFESVPVPSTVTESSKYSAGYEGVKCADFNLTDDWWVSQSPPVYPEYVTYDYGTAQYFDTAIVGGAIAAGSVTSMVKDGAIEYSDDGAAWSNAATFASLFGASPGTQFMLKRVALSTPGSHRYWRLKVSANYGFATYVGCTTWWLFDTTQVGTRLDSLPPTLTSAGANVVNASKLQDETMAVGDFGYHYAGAGMVRSLDIDFASARFLGGLSHYNYLGATGYRPARVDLFYSSDGSAWSFGETFVPPAEGSTGTLQTWTFSRIYYARYFRLLCTGGTSGTLFHEWYLHATLAPVAPGAPTSLVVTGDPDDNAALQLRWTSPGASDDNLAGDLDFEVQRAKDGGAYATVATVQTAYYVDPGLAAGSYTYKVRAVNHFHAQAGAYTAASTAVVVPVAASGSAPRILVGA